MSDELMCVHLLFVVSVCRAPHQSFLALIAHLELPGALIKYSSQEKLNGSCIIFLKAPLGDVCATEVENHQSLTSTFSAYFSQS